MWLFGLKPNPEVYIIVDDAGRFPITQAYRDLGVSEGWLTYSGEYLGDNNQIVVYYNHSPPIRITPD